MTKFARLDRLPPYVFATVNQIKMDARRAGEDIIDLGMGNPDLGTPQHIVDKMTEAAQKPHNHRYSASMGITRLRKAISTWYADRYGVDIDPDSETIVTIGVKEGMSHLILVTIRPGDVVFTPNPTYPIHPYSAIIAGGDVRGIPVGPGQDFFENLVAATPPDLAAAQGADFKLPPQSHHRGDGSGIFPENRGFCQGKRHPGHPRLRLRRPDFRRVPGAEHPPGQGGQGRGRGIFFP